MYGVARAVEEEEGKKSNKAHKIYRSIFTHVCYIEFDFRRERVEKNCINVGL